MANYDAYLPEWEEFLKVNAPLMSRKELTEAFNAKFGTNKSVSGIRQACNARGYNSSSDGRFKKGQISWQAGLHGDDYKKHFTEESYKRIIDRARQGNRTRKELDEIVIKGVPYIVTSTKFGVPYYERRYPKRRFVWEQLYGEIPKDHCVVCLDGNQMNCEPSNLYCIPNSFKAILSRNKWWFKNPELTLATIKWCELHFAIKNVNGSDE